MIIVSFNVGCKVIRYKGTLFIAGLTKFDNFEIIKTSITLDNSM